MASDHERAAALRVNSAAQRVAELRQRLERLSAGESSTAEDVRRARARADAQLVETTRARERLVLARLASAHRHRDAAAILDRIGCHEQAAEHRAAAVRDEETARTEIDGGHRGTHPSLRKRVDDAAAASRRLGAENNRLREALVTIMAFRDAGGAPGLWTERRRRIWEALADQCRKDDWASWAKASCTVAREMLPRIHGVALTALDDSGPSSPLAASDDWTREVTEIGQIVGDGPALDALSLNHPLVVEDLGRAHDRWPLYVASTAGTGLRSLWAFPLHLDRTTLGTMIFYGRTSIAPQPEEWLDATVLADIASTALLADIFAIETGSHAGPPYDPLHVAAGVVSVQLDISPGEALSRIRAHAFASSSGLVKVATEILNGTLRLD